MSRIGKEPIQIPDGVNVSLKGDVVLVKGPLGELSQKLKGVTVSIKDGVIYVHGSGEDKVGKALWGLHRALIANMIEGVTRGCKKSLEIVGVGYRAGKKGNGLTISVGYSNPVEFEPPAGITLDVEESTKITVSGIDKALVGQVAAQIRSIRKPEPYKGKGIKYSDEVVRRKAGKAQAKAAA